MSRAPAESALIFASSFTNKIQKDMQINQNAPVIANAEIFINATPEQVWAVLTNINQWTKWNSKISKSVVHQPVAKGSTFSWTINGAKIQSQLHTVDTNKSLGWSGKTFGATAIHNFYLSTSGEGTLVKVEESMEGWLVRLFKNKMNKDLAKDMVYWLEQLKMESER